MSAAILVDRMMDPDSFVLMLDENEFGPVNAAVTSVRDRDSNREGGEGRTGEGRGGEARCLCLLAEELLVRRTPRRRKRTNEGKAPRIHRRPTIL